MKLMTVLLLMVAELGPGFSGGAATATAAGSGRIEVVLTVNVATADGPVVAHLALPGEDVSTRPMLDGGDGTWRAVFEVRQADWQVVFEAVTATRLSESVSLSTLGVDPALLGPRAGPPHSIADITPSAPPWGWLSVASAAAALAIVLGLTASGSLRPRHRRR